MLNRTRNGADCICSAVILICIVFGLMGCFFSALGMEEANGMLQGMLVFLVPFAFVCSFLFCSREAACIGLPVMVVLLSILAGICRKQLLFCLRFCVFRAGGLFSHYYGLGLSFRIDSKGIYSDEFYQGLFLLTLCVIFLLSIDVAGFFYVKRIFFLSAAMLFFIFCIGKMPSAFFALLLFTGLAALAASSAKRSDVQKKWRLGRNISIPLSGEEEQEPRDALLHGGQKAALFSAVCFLLALFLGWGLEARLGDRLISFYEPIQQWANEMEYRILHYDYGNLFSELGRGVDTKGAQGKLSNQEIHYTGKEVLRVTVDKLPKEGMYLRGFVGKDYKGDHWSKISEYNFAKETQGWELEKSAELSGEIASLGFKVLQKNYLASDSLCMEYIDAPGRYAYLPYFTKLENNIAVFADGVSERTKKQGSLPSVLHTSGFWQETMDVYQQECSIDWPVLEREKQLAEFYGEYVKKEYLYVPESLEKLRKACEKQGHRGMLEISGFIRDYLWNHAEYSLKLASLPYGEDFTEYFLYEQRKGYCIHFATAAVLMYRLYGIPARFVEGYVVFPEDFVENEDGTYTASVPDSRAHAWAEVYDDMLGFVPVDMTPQAGIIAQDVTRQGQAGDAVGTEADSTQPGQAEENRQGFDEKNQEQNVELPEDEPDTGFSEETDSETEGKETGSEESDLEGIGTQGEEEISGEGVQEMSGSGSGNGGKKEIDTTGNDMAGNYKKSSLIFLWKVVLLIAGAVGMLFLFMGGFILYGRIRYHKKIQALLGHIQEKERRKVVLASAGFYEYLRILGYERVWKNSGKNLSDRKYQEMLLRELPFVERRAYSAFREIVQRALYSPFKEEPAISEQEAKECCRLARLWQQHLYGQAMWYRRILLKGIVGK